MRDGRDGIKPGSQDAWRRQIQRLAIHADRDTPLRGIDRMFIFGGPGNLLPTASRLAHAVSDWSDRLICHPDDYRAAGLHRNGYVTFLAIATSWRLNPAFDPSVPPELPRKCALEPDPRCPRDEVRVRPV